MECMLGIKQYNSDLKKHIDIFLFIMALPVFHQLLKHSFHCGIWHFHSSQRQLSHCKTSRTVLYLIGAKWMHTSVQSSLITQIIFFHYSFLKTDILTHPNAHCSEVLPNYGKHWQDVMTTASHRKTTAFRLILDQC